MRTLMKVLAVTIVALTATGCATQARLAALDKQFDEGWRPGKGYCLFGGETEKINNYCARMYFGVEGELQAINASVIASLPPEAKCRDHANAALAAIKQVPDLKGELVYSCPKVGSTTCHVSVLVKDPSGNQWVMDNRAVVSSTLGVNGVTNFTAFAGVLDNVYWVGLPPSADEVAMLASTRGKEWSKLLP